MPDRPVRRVLFYRLGSLGDMLIALPAVKLAARAFPGAERRLLTNVPVSSKAPAAAAVFADMTGPDGKPLIDGYLRYVVGLRNPLDLLKLWWQIRRFRPDVLIYIAAARGREVAARDAKFFRFCGLGRQIGVPLTDGMQLNFYGASTGNPIGLNLEPEAARLVRNISELGNAHLEDQNSWDLQVTQSEAAAALEAIRTGAPDQNEQGMGASGPVSGTRDLQDVQRRLKPIAVSVGTKVQSKDWGRENWRSLLTAVAREFPDRALLLAGAPEESEASEYTAGEWQAAGGGPVINLCGKLTPRQSAAAFAQAAIFIGHDSGPMHLAASVATPCIALFAARNVPRQWFPFGANHRVLYHPVDCMGCGLETCIEQRKKCLLSITVEEVMVEIRAALHAGKDPNSL
jgi:ADP-heptose:LPS heptosyltransferase